MDQRTYIYGSSTVEFWGNMYGLAVRGPVCNITVQPYRHANGGHSEAVIGGTTDTWPFFVLTTADHTAFVTVTTFSYSAQTTAASKLTLLQDASGSVSTERTPLELPRNIILINETYNDPCCSYTLVSATYETLPPQSPTFQTKAGSFENSNVFYTPDQGVQVCNTDLTLEGWWKTGFNTPCIGLILP